MSTMIDRPARRGYLRAIMRMLRNSSWLRLLAAVVFLCFVAQGIASELEHIGVIHLHAHAGGPSDGPLLPDDDDNPPSHHHHGDMFFSAIDFVAPIQTALTFSISDTLCNDGPVFGIEYPPQLS